jgi:hypothetical protein
MVAPSDSNSLSTIEAPRCTDDRGCGHVFGPCECRNDLGGENPTAVPARAPKTAAHERNISDVGPLIR